MNKCKEKIMLFIIGAIILLSHTFAFAQKYNESDKEVLRKFGRKPSAVPGKLNIDMMWRTTGIPFDTNSWYANENWVTSLIGVIWDGTKNGRILNIYWKNHQLADSIDLSGCDQLNILNIQENKITGVNITDSPNLKVLYCGINQLKHLDVSKNPKLTDLDFCHNQISSIDVSNNTKVTWFCAEYNRLTELNLAGLNLIKSIWLNNNKLKFSSLVVNNPRFVKYFMFPQDTTGLDDFCRKEVDFSAEYSFADSLNHQVKTSFSWYKLEGTNEIPVPAQNVTDSNGVFSFNPVDPGQYRCKMANSAFSANETIICDFYLFDGNITQQPQSQMLCPEKSVMLFVNTPTQNITYQWQLLNNNNNVWEDIAGAVQNIWNAWNEGKYRVLLKSQYCHSVSDTAAIVNSKTSFITGKTPDCRYDPKKKLTVDAEYVADYKWKLNGIDLLCDSASCPIFDTGSYVAKVVDVCGMTDTAIIHVGIEPMKIYVNNILLADNLETMVDCKKDFAVIDVFYDTLYHPEIFIDAYPYSSYDYPFVNGGQHYVIVKTIDTKGREMKYPLSIYKPFNADIFRTRWEDVLVVPLKIEGVEGLEESVKVEWFRMKDTISYEKLDRNSDKGYIQIKKNGDYFVIINDIYRFCPISFVLPAHVPQLFPNPSHPNASITLATGLKEEELGNTKILLINERGNVISKFDLKDASPQLIAPAVSGIYTVIIESPDSDVKQMKMVVVN